METLAEKAQRLGMKPAGKPVVSSSTETLAQKAQRLGIKPKAGDSFRYDAPVLPIERQNRIAQYQQEAQASAEESKKANSAWGIFKNTIKGVGSTLANSEVGLGKSIAKIIGAGDKTLQDAQQRMSDTQIALMKAIREKEAKGEDATRLKQAYNQMMNDPSKWEIDQLAKEQFNLPTTGEVVGQIGGTALDVLTAGTYGKAVKPMASGFLYAPKLGFGKVASTVVPELGQIATQKASGMFTKQGVKNIATGTGIGYASDVTQGLQGARGEDRTGAKAFIPGAGTALGFALPAISEGTQSVKNVRSGKVATDKRYNALLDLEKKNGKIAKVFRAGDRKGIDVRKALSENNLLNGAVDGDGRISKELAIDNFNTFIKPYEKEVRNSLQAEGRKLTQEEIASFADSFLSTTRIKGGARKRLETEIIDDLTEIMNKKGTVDLTDIHDLKVFRGEQNNYVDTGVQAVNKEATRFYKELVEKNTQSIDVKRYNTEMSKLYAVRDAINAMDRAVVKGGRAGKYFATTAGSIIGASSGNPFLALAGAEVGNQVQSAVLRNAFGGNINKAIEPSKDLLSALATKKTGKDVVPSVVLPKAKNPIQDLNIQSSESQALTRQANKPSTMSPKTNAIPSTVLPIKDFSTKKSTGEKYASRREQAVAEISVELGDLSQAGYRYSVDGEYRGVSSTFPKWIPEHLRSKDLFEKTMPLVEKNTPPPENATQQRELYDLLQKEIDTRAEKPASILPKNVGNEAFAGIGMGIEQDEDGNMSFSPEKALAGMVGVAGLTRSQKVQKLSKGLDDTMRKSFINFIDVVRGGKVKTQDGKLVFSDDEAKKYFNAGIDFINGDANHKLDLAKLTNGSFTKIANFFEDVVDAPKGKEWNGTKSSKPSAGTSGGFDGLMSEAKKYKSAEEFVKAQGTPVYHGGSKKRTFQDYKVNAGEYGLTQRTDSPLGIYFAEDSGIAQSFGKEIMAGRVKSSKILDVSAIDNPYDALNKLGFTDEEINAFPFDVSEQSYKRYWGSQYNHIEQALKRSPEKLKRLKEQYDGIRFLDKTGSTQHPTIVVFDPKKVLTDSQLTDIWKKANKK